MPERKNVYFKVLVFIGKAIAVFANLTFGSIGRHEEFEILIFGKTVFNFNAFDGGNVFFDGLEIDIMPVKATLS